MNCASNNRLKDHGIVHGILNYGSRILAKPSDLTVPVF